MAIVRHMSSCAHHEGCIEQALQHADEACRRKGGRLTKTRRQVLELLWQSHQPRKAYDVLADLVEIDASAKPPTVYRALDFLQEMGLVHKVESLNAYIGCNGNHRHQYLVCQKCNAVADIKDDTVTSLVQEKARDMGFRIETPHIEIKGYCERCFNEQ